jgi:hypothetical protein
MEIPKTAFEVETSLRKLGICFRTALIDLCVIYWIINVWN